MLKLLTNEQTERDGFILRITSKAIITFNYRFR